MYKYLSMEVKGSTKHFSADLEEYNWRRSLHRIPIYVRRVGLKDDSHPKEENQIFKLETGSYILTWQLFILCV